MYTLTNKHILVIGLGASGRAACELLHRRGARVTAIDSFRTEKLVREAEQLGALGVQVQLAAGCLPAAAFDLAVISPGVPSNSGFHSRMQVGVQASACLLFASARPSKTIYSLRRAAGPS